MATGILGTSDVPATTNTTVYTVPAATFAIVTISVCNRSSSNRDVRVALAASDTPVNAEYIEFDTELVANGTLERGGVVIDATKKIVVYANSTDCSVVVYGIETATS